MAVQLDSVKQAQYHSVPVKVVHFITELFWSIVNSFHDFGKKELIVAASIEARGDSVCSVGDEDQLPGEMSVPFVSPDPAKQEVPAAPKKLPLPIVSVTVDPEIIMQQRRLFIQHPDYCRHRYFLGNMHLPSYVERIDVQPEEFSSRPNFRLGGLSYQQLLAPPMVEKSYWQSEPVNVTPPPVTREFVWPPID